MQQWRDIVRRTTGAVFLDRDGVINAMVAGSGGVDSPRRLREFALLPGAVAAIRRLNDLGRPVIVISNQPGIAKGKTTPAELAEMTRLLHAQLAAAEAHLAAVYYCLHHPEAALPEYRRRCDCRKPLPGLLRQAAADFSIDLRASYMVGDRTTDIMAGRAAGCTTVLVQDGADRSRGDDPIVEADHVCADLAAAARWIRTREDWPNEIQIQTATEEEADADLCRYGGPSRNQAVAGVRRHRRGDDEPLYYVGGRGLQTPSAHR